MVTRSACRTIVRRARRLSIPGYPHVEMAHPREIARAVSRLPGDLAWESLHGTIVPLFPRIRPVTAEAGKLVTIQLPPGVTVGFGVDLGPAFLFVTESIAAGWGQTPASLADVALQNLRRRAAAISEKAVQRDSVAGEGVRYLQTDDGCGSTLVLLPDELTRLFGPAPALFTVPTRNLVLAFDPGADRYHIGWVTLEIEAIDPNGLHQEGFLLRNGRMWCEPIHPAFEGQA